MRKRSIIYGVAVAAILIATAVSLSAQNLSGLTFHVGGGVSPLTGRISKGLNTGWHFDVGAGIRLDPSAEVTLDYRYNGFGVKDVVPMTFQVPNSHARVWSVTVDPKLRIPIESPVNPYVVGGIGYYRRSVDLTSPTVTQSLLYDPFFDAFFSVPFAAEQILGTINRSGIGGSLGAGFEIKLQAGDATPRFFGQARYEYANTGNVPTRMVPVTFGIRW